MVAIICTIIICLTVLLCVFKVCDAFKQQELPEDNTQQLTEADLEKAYKEAEKDKAPDFQDVIEFINKEFTGITEDDDEG